MATPEQWADTEYWAQQHGHAQACILELRARVEQLEANSKPTPKDRQIRSSLVDRVAIAIDHLPTKDWNKETWDDEARAAIREVALWLNKAPLDLYPGDRSIVVNALYDQANQ